MKTKDLTPIGVSTYSRLEHLKQTITALQANSLAKKSKLFVFSDAPKPGDEEKVKAVRNFLKTIDGFNQVEIVERQTNSPIYNNRQGMRMLLERYNKMIFMEEDIVTAPSFLEYMNYMLDTYEDDPRVLSITGFCPSMQIPKDYPYNIFFYPRFDPWGFGIWKDRFELIENGIPQNTIRDIFRSASSVYQFTRVGLDVLPAALNNYYGFKNHLDAIAYTQQFSLKMLTIHPVKSLVRNIGLDGTGAHPKKKTWFETEPYNGTFKIPSLPSSLTPDARIMKNFYKIRSKGWRGVRQIAWLATVIFKILFRRGETK